MTNSQKKIPNRTCNGCYYEHKRTCYWFKLVHGSMPKMIPMNTFNEGCKQYKNNVSIGYKAGNKLTDRIINTFNGEIVSDKYQPPVKKRKTYKRKYVKSPHNYSYRKDAQ